jgi:hypothetical protein
MAQRVAGIWFSSWAIRHRWDLDYQLGPRARFVRWGLVAVCYGITQIPGADFGPVRFSGGMIGLCFICWPNFAYHLNKLSEDWPTTNGTVGTSQEKSASRWAVSYDYEFDGKRWGGTATVKSIPGLAIKDAYPDGASIIVRFDPLNPKNSAVVGRPHQQV